MWSWFGGAAAQKRKDAPKTAILQLRGTLDMLQKREKHLEAQIGEQDAAARKYVNTNKNGMVLPHLCRIIDKAEIILLTRHFVHSRQECPTTEEGSREEPGVNDGSDHSA